MDISDHSSPSILTEHRGILSEWDEGPLHRILDVKVSGTNLLVMGELQLVRDGNTSAAVLFDVSNPSSPERISVHPVPFDIHNGYLEGTTAYLTGFGAVEQPTVIVDMETSSELGRWSPIDANEAWGDVAQVFRVCHDLYAIDDRLYVAYWDAGTWVLDVSTPSQPTAIAQIGGGSPQRLSQVDDRDAPRQAIELPGNSHNVRPSPDGEVLAVGHEAFDVDETEHVGGPGGITLWDISALTSPKVLTTLAPPRPAEGSDPSRIAATTTTHNFAWRDRRLYTSWYRGGVRVFDLSDPLDPKLLAAWRDESTSFAAARPSANGFVASELGIREQRDQNEDKDTGGLYCFPEPSMTGEPASTRDWNTPYPTFTPSPSPSATPPSPSTPIRTAPEGSPTASFTAATGDGFGILSVVLGGLCAGKLLSEQFEGED